MAARNLPQTLTLTIAIAWFDDIDDHRYHADTDDLDLSIQHRTAGNAAYRELLDAEVRRQRLIAQLVAIRKSNGMTQTAVAEIMHVRQSVVAEIESAKADIRFSTLDRCAEAVSGGQLSIRLVHGAP